MMTPCVGAMGSYVVFNLAGLYPVPATRQFLLSSPYFREISFRNPTFGTTTTIRSINFAGNPTGGDGGTVFVKVSRPSWHSKYHFGRISDACRAERDCQWTALQVKLLS